MKGWLLTAGKFEDEVERLLSNVNFGGHTLEIIDCGKAAYGIDNGLPSRIWIDGKEETPPDFFYIADSDGENGVVFPFARQLEQLGSYNYNPIEAKKAAMSKIETYQILAREGVPIVKTLVFRESMSKDLILSEIGLPLIMKPDDGFGGIGVELIKTEEELDQMMEKLSGSQSRMLIQKYVASSKGRDVRVLTIGFEAVFAAQRKASDPNEFRSNLHVGGTTEEYPLTEEMKELCHKVSKAIGLRMAGIDLLFGEDGFVVGEVNSSAGFDSWLGKKDLISVFMNDLKKQMLKQPLAHWRVQQLKEAAKRAQLPEILMGLDDYGFLKSTEALYADCKGTQELVLFEILNACKDTEFGKEHNFEEIHSLEDFRDKVKLSEWADYAPYSERLQAGESDLLFPGKANFFYRTSGTTASYKFIPESEREAVARKAISRARITEIFMMTSPAAASRVFAFFNKPALDMTSGGIPCGTASGRSSELASPELVKHLTYVPQVVNEFEGDELLYVMLRCSLVYGDVTALLGNNAKMMTNLCNYAVLHADELIEDIRNGGIRYEMSDGLKEMLKDQLAPHPERADELQKLNEEGKFTPRYYWPNLMAAGFWLGGSVGVHVNEVRKMLPETTKYIDVGYGASETKFNIPTKPETPAGVLSTFTCFYEFIPEEGGEPLFAWELEDQKNYELILTTNAGLYRYRLKDLVHVDGFTGDTPNIYFVTKLTDVANLAQEKIPGSMLAEAISAVCEEEGVGCQIAQVYPDPEGMRYVICLEPDRAPADEKAFAEALDKGLCDKLIQYATYRNKLLNPCGLVLKEEGWGAQLMKKYAKGNATVAQVKVPVVIDKLP